MTKLKLITGEKAIMAACKAAYNATEKSSMAVHTVLCSALDHVMKHGNTVVLEKVYAELHQSMTLKGVGAFIRKFTNLRAMGEIDEKTGEETGRVLFRKPGKKPIAIALDDAMANPFWTLPEVIRANTALWDIEKRFLSLLGQARFHLGKEDVTDKDKGKQIVASLEQIAKDYKLDLTGIPSVADGKAAKGTDKTVADVTKTDKPATANENKPARKRKAKDGTTAETATAEPQAA